MVKWLMSLISSDVTEPQALWFIMHVCIKPGGAPDKLCIFPADESLLTQNSRCRGITGLSSASMTVTVFFHA